MYICYRGVRVQKGNNKQHLASFSSAAFFGYKKDRSGLIYRGVSYSK